MDELRKTKILLPPDKEKAEQQKIASCLSSLDEVISAESQKLEVLKDHKKGLLQNLFPKEGETVPKFRFKEFEDSGEWVEKKLGEVYEFKVTNSFSRDCLQYENGEVKNIHYGDIHTKFNTLFDISKENVPFINSDIPIEKIKEECYCREGDVIFADASEDLNDVGKSIEVIKLDNKRLVSGLHTLLARQRDYILTIGFGGYLFKSDWIRKQIQREAQGAKVLGISASRISNINIKFPKSNYEQQKIASTLSSIDDLINAQNQKLEALQLHKKGLLQGMFPNTLTN
ncbi:MAG: restriction endonuclease subunit S [Sphingobacteriales bacterium]|nr:MAG: restriction endonuclease subunit S [Sphingobacteriales bacterium]